MHKLSDHFRLNTYSSKPSTRLGSLWIMSPSHYKKSITTRPTSTFQNCGHVFCVLVHAYLYLCYRMDGLIRGYLTIVVDYCERGIPRVYYTLMILWGKFGLNREFGKYTQHTVNPSEVKQHAQWVVRWLAQGHISHGLLSELATLWSSSLKPKPVPYPYNKDCKWGSFANHLVWLCRIFPKNKSQFRWWSPRLMAAVQVKQSEYWQPIF